MAGLLDFLNTPAGMGLLSGVASYAANARKGAPINNIGRGLAGGLTGYTLSQEELRRQAEDADTKKYRDMQMSQMEANNKRITVQQEREEALRQKILAGLKPGQPSSIPSQMMGDMPFNMGADAPVESEAKPPTFFGKPIDEATAAFLPDLPVSDALKLAHGKDQEWDTTPRYDQQGRAFVTSKTGQIKYLDGIQERPDPNKPFKIGPNGEIVPNDPYQKYEFTKAEKGASRMSQNNFGEPKPYWNAKTRRYEFYQYDKQGNPKAAQLPEGVEPADQGHLGEAQVKQLVGIKALQGAVGEYQNALKDWKLMSVVSPDARAEMGVKYNNMMLQAKEAYNLGVLNGPDFEILTSVVTDPRSMMGTITSKKALEKQATELARIMGNVGNVVSTKQRPGGGEDVPPPKEEANNKKPTAEVSASFKMLPNAAELDGATVKDTATGKRYRSQGGKWVEVK